MSLTDIVIARREAQQTFRPSAAATILRLALAATTAAATVQSPSPGTTIILSETQGTLSPSHIAKTSDGHDLAAHLGRIHDYLMSEQTDLDNDAYQALYANLWDMYE